MRAGAVILNNDLVALIERFREGNHYFVFPGGRVNKKETIEEAVVREVLEETGLEVVVDRLLAENHFRDEKQYYFLVDFVGGILDRAKAERWLALRHLNMESISLSGRRLLGYQHSTAFHGHCSNSCRDFLMKVFLNEQSSFRIREEYWHRRKVKGVFFQLPDHSLESWKNTKIYALERTQHPVKLGERSPALEAGLPSAQDCWVFIVMRAVWDRTGLFQGYRRREIGHGSGNRTTRYRKYFRAISVQNNGAQEILQ